MPRFPRCAECPMGMFNARSIPIAVRDVAAGFGAGAVVGLVVGGPMARAYMFALRQSTPTARGLTSDDGFVVGRFSAQTLTLAVACAAICGVVGGFYVLVRSMANLGPWAVGTPFVGAATLVGTTVIASPDGIDFVLLDPLWFAIGGLLAIGVACGALTVTLVERWLGGRPLTWIERRVLRPWAWVLATIAVPVLVAQSLGAVLITRLGSTIRRGAAPAAITVLLALIGVSAVALVRDVQDIADLRRLLPRSR